MKLLDLLRAIGKRPQMYIGDFPRNRVSIWHLKSFLVGYQCGTRRETRPEGDDILDNFAFWVCTRFGVPEGAMSWAGHILERCGKDDEAAFKMFFELLEVYVKDLEQVGSEAIKARYMEMIQKRSNEESQA